MDAVILAGGLSRRMGTDKAELEIAGQRLVERVYGRLVPVADRILVARGSQPPTGVGDEVEDVPWTSGPMAGIVAALQRLEGREVALVGVDMPEIEPRLFERLGLLCRAGDRSAAMPVVDGHPQPLHSVIMPSGVTALIEVARTGERSPRRALGRIDAYLVHVDGWADLDPGGHFATDLDTPEDLGR